MQHKFYLNKMKVPITLLSQDSIIKQVLDKQYQILKYLLNYQIIIILTSEKQYRMIYYFILFGIPGQFGTKLNLSFHPSADEYLPDLITGPWENRTIDIYRNLNDTVNFYIRYHDPQKPEAYGQIVTIETVKLEFPDGKQHYGYVVDQQIWWDNNQNWIKVAQQEIQ